MKETKKKNENKKLIIAIVVIIGILIIGATNGNIREYVNILQNSERCI